MQNGPKVALIINTCQAFYETTIPPFIETAQKANVPKEHIYVVVGESDTEIPFQLSETQTHQIAHCLYKNIDYNAAIYLTQTQDGQNILEKYDYFFYIHDTAELMSHFWEKINKYAQSCVEKQTPYIKLSPTHTKNIGLIQSKWFLQRESHTHFFKSIVNTNSDLKREYKTGNFPNKQWLYDNITGLCPWNLGEDCLFVYDGQEPVGEWFHNHIDRYITHLYGSNEPRLASIYNEPGLIKFQKNWGQPGADWSMSL